jgi:YHS domain-containing protein
VWKDRSGDENLKLEQTMPKTVEPAIGGYSPVSYFEKGQAEQGNSEFQSEHEGKTYFFTSAAQVKTFQANPDKFAPAFGGQCAYGHVVEKEFPVDPTNFKIEDGKLLLFLKNAEVDAKALWEKEGDVACMVKANRHWSKVNQG